MDNLLSQEELAELLKTLKQRFDKNMHRHKGLDWTKVQEKLMGDMDKCWSLMQMEATGGEPDVIGIDEKTSAFIFTDCSAESPKNRRSLCYDRKALDARKENKPANSIIDMASEMGIAVLNEQEYKHLQTLGEFDLKTSSWIETPEDIRKLGGAIFCDRRYNTVFTYHNGADSYYAARGFRGKLMV